MNKNKLMNRVWMALMAFLLFSTTMTAQVTIGDEVLPRKGAILDLKKQSSSSTAYVGGLVLPNVDIPNLGLIPSSFSDAATMSGALDVNLELTGTVVYNTNTTTGEGVYYWDGNDWKKINTSGGGMTVSPYPPAAITPSGGTTPPVTVTDPSCTIAGSYSYLVIAGQDYASVDPSTSSDGIFAVMFQPNNTAFERKAVVMITNPCGESTTFVFSQTGASCPGTHANPTLNASSGTICGNGMFYAFVTNADPAASYIWTKNNVVVNTGIAFQTDQPGAYQVYTDLVGCGTPASITLTKDNGNTSESPVTISATNSGVICDGGGSVTLTAFNVPSGGTVNWYKEGVLRGTGTTLVLTNGATDAGTWFAAIGSGTACQSTPSNQVAITTSSATALTPPAFTINGLDPASAVYCQGGLLELQVTTDYSSLSGITYQWYVNGQAATPAPSTSPVYYTVPATGDLSFSVLVLKSGYCSSSAASPTQAVTFTASPETNINQSKTTFICGNNQAILTAGVSGASEYQWFKTENGVDTKIVTGTTDSYTTNVEGKYKVTYKDGNGCVSKLSSAVEVVRSNTISLNWGLFPTTVHPSDVLSYSVVASPEPDKYTWSADNGAIVTPMANGKDANIEFVNLGATTITVVAENGCGPVTLVSASPINVINACTPVTSVQITPNAGFDQKEGVSKTFTASANGSDNPTAKIFTWFVDGIQVQSGAGTTYAFTPTAAVGASQKVKVTVTNDCGTATSNEISVKVTVNPANYQDYTGATYSLTGQNCFDVKMGNYNPTCGEELQRKNDFESGFSFSYTFNGTGYTDLIFAREDGSAITEGIIQSGNTGTLTFVSSVRNEAAGTDNTTAKVVTVYALFKVGGIPYKVALPIKVKDCTCCETMSDRQGNFYKTRLYGAMCMMVQNLKVTVKKDGTAMRYTSYIVTNDGNNYSYPNLAVGNVATMGLFYDYKTALNVCPTGWHLPSDTEWTDLQSAGANGAAELTANWKQQGYPGYIYSGTAQAFGTYTYWWSATPSSSAAYYRALNNSDTSFRRSGDNQSAFYSVRCLRD